MVRFRNINHDPLNGSSFEPESSLLCSSRSISKLFSTRIVYFVSNVRTFKKDEKVVEVLVHL